MKFNELIYFQAKKSCVSSGEESFLFRRIVHFIGNDANSETLDLCGLYLKKNKYGRYVYKKILVFDSSSLISKEKSVEPYGVLIYKYLSLADCQFLGESMTSGGHIDAVYVVAHKYYSCEEIISNLLKSGVPLTAIHLIVSSESKSDFIEGQYGIGRRFSAVGVSVTPIHLPTLDISRKETKTAFFKAVFVPFFLIQALRYILNPLSELKKLIQSTKVLQSVYLIRMYELMAFLKFILIFVGLKTYYPLYQLLGAVKLVLLKLFYKIRHSILMSNFKAFGYLVDGYHAVRRSFVFVRYSILSRIRHQVLMLFFKIYGVLFDVVVEFYYQWVFAFFYSFLRHRFLMSYYKAYGLCYDFFVAVGYKTRHLVLMSYYKAYGLCYDFFVAVGYKTRHLALMCFYKSYGYLIDSFHVFYRVMTFYVPYPLYKVYWFLRYQYEYRFKSVLQRLHHD